MRLQVGGKWTAKEPRRRLRIPTFSLQSITLRRSVKNWRINSYIFSLCCYFWIDLSTPCLEKVLSFFWITLTNLNLFLQFLAHIIRMIHFTKTCRKLAFEIYLSLSVANVIMTSLKTPFLQKGGVELSLCNTIRKHHKYASTTCRCCNIRSKFLDILIKWIFRMTLAKNYENIFKFAKDMSRVTTWCITCWICPFSALTLLLGWHEGHIVYRKACSVSSEKFTSIDWPNLE